MNVLVGDGHPMARLGMVRVLGALLDGVQCCETGSFADCLAAAQNDTFDLVIVDTAMKDMSWNEGLRRLRECCGGTPIITTSAEEVRTDIFKMIELGASGFVPRTADEAQLTKAINLVLSGAVYLPRAIINATDTADGKPAAGRTTGGSISETAMPMLTKRQREVLKLLAEGKRNSEIAEILGTSEFTVRVHVSAILKGLGVANRTQAALKAQDVLRDD
jgi:DNA-binding NarL/FixJ family response regulator